jgi:hypothetical protein
MQWQARPEGPAGEALLSGGWWRFLAAPHAYYDHRRPASKQAAATSPGSAAGSAASFANSSCGSSGGGGNSGASSTANAAPAGSRAAGAVGCDFSHQRDPGDALALRDAPAWVRQRVAAMDADPASSRVRAEVSMQGQAGVCCWSVTLKGHDDHHGSERFGSNSGAGGKMSSKPTATEIVSDD